MQQINFETITSPKDQPSKTGQRPSGRGVATRSSGAREAIPLQSLPMALGLLTDLVNNFRETPLGQTPQIADTIPEAMAKLSMLRQMMVRGRPDDVLTIIRRLFANWEVYRAPADSVPEDWARHLADMPIASIWACYENHIGSPGKKRPTLGDFKQDVQRHTGLIVSLGKRLKLAIEAKETQA